MKRQHRAGYSLVEVICVLAIIAILAVIAVPSISRLISKANEDNCSVAMEQFIKDIQLDCAATRFADIAAADALLREKTERAADTAVTFSMQTAPGDGQTATCETDGICPNNGTYTLRWTLTPVPDAYAAQLTMDYGCTCTEEATGSFTMLLALKHPITLPTDFYDALKSNLAVLRRLSELRAKELIATGKSAPYCALKLAGRISAGARLYQCEGVSGGVAVNPVSQLTATTANLATLLTIDPLLGTTDNDVLWGITLNDAGEVEWISYYCRYLDPDGVQSTYFVVWSDGEFVTTKENYCNLANATANEGNPPIEGQLGSAAVKSDWIETAANQNKDRVGVVRTCGIAYPDGASTTHWNQRDGNWYVQGWGIYTWPNFGSDNLISKRRLTHLTVAYVSGDGFSPADSLIVTAHYDDGTTVTLPSCKEAFLDTYNIDDVPSVWYLTNGYFLADSDAPAEQWHTALPDAQRMLARSDANAQAFSARQTDEITIVYREYYKSYAPGGRYTYEPVTATCKLRRSFVDLRLAAGTPTDFTLDDLLAFARFRVTLTYTDADGTRVTQTQPELAEEGMSHGTAGTFSSGRQGYFFRRHSTAQQSTYSNDAALLRELGEGSWDLDVIYYAPKVGTVQVSGRLTKALDRLSATYEPHETSFFYLDRLSVTAEYAVTLTDTSGTAVVAASRLLPHRMANRDGFLMTLNPGPYTDAADWASGTDSNAIRALVGGDGRFTLGLLYQDGVLRRTDLELDVKPTKVQFVWSDISGESDMARDAVTVTEYFGENTVVFFPYYVVGSWITAGSDDEAISRGYAPGDLYRVSDSGTRYYYINDGTLHTVERIGLLKPTDGTDSRYGQGATDWNNMKQYTVKLPRNVVGIDIPEGVREIGVFAFQNREQGQTGALTNPLYLPASVERVGRCAFSCTPISGLYFAPDSNLTRIDSAAFERCTALAGSVTLPGGLTAISEDAFSGCTGISGDLTIPDTVRYIGTGAFVGCGTGTGALFAYGGSDGTSLRLGVFDGAKFHNVTIGGSASTITKQDFQDKTGFTGDLTLAPGASFVLEYAFADCTGFDGTLTLPDTLLKIEGWGFGNCPNFSGDLLVPASVQAMGDNAFNNFGTGTGKLTLYGTSQPDVISTAIFTGSRFHDVTIGGSVKTVGYAAFAGCTGHTGTLTLEASVTTINTWGFYGCTNYDGDLLIPETVTRIEHEAFYGFSANKGEGSLTLRGTSEENVISSGIFTNAAFTDVTIGGNVQLIGNLAFANGAATAETKGLRGSLTIQDGVTEVFYGAFLNCPELTGNLTIPKTVITIGTSAFEGCTGMTGLLSFDFSDDGGVREIGTQAFQGTKFTGDLVLPVTLRTIGFRAFADCLGFSGSLRILTGGTAELPQGLQTIGDESFSGCCNFSTDLTIPETVTAIGNLAFYQFGTGAGALYFYGECEPASGMVAAGRFTQAKFRNVTIGGKVRTIDKQAFQENPGLTGTLTILETVTFIDYRAFYNCTGFTGDLLIPATVREIGREAFLSCNGFNGTLTFQTVDAPNQNGLWVKKGIEIIGENAFCWCENFIGDLVIPATVTTLGDGAFSCFGQFGGVRDGTNPDASQTDLTRPSLGSLYCYANVEMITPNAFGWTHFDNTILIQGARGIAEAAFFRQTARYFIILGNAALQPQSLACGYRHPKVYLGEQVSLFNDGNPFYHNVRAADNLCPDGYYNEAAYVAERLTGLALRSEDGGCVYLRQIANHKRLLWGDFAFYKAVCAAVGVTLPPYFSPYSGYDPLATALGCHCSW